MDDIALLARVRAEVTEPAPEALARSRERLLVRAASRPGRSRRPLLAAGAVVVAAGLAAFVVLGGGGATPPASAAGLLHQAADSQADQPVTGPGEYLAVETREDALGYVQDDTGEVVGAYLAQTVSVTYVPHERSERWVVRSWSLPPTTFYGGAQVRAAAARDYAQSAHADAPNVERAFNGSFGNGELGGGSSTGAEDLDGLPRDPERLLAHLEATPMASTSRGEKVIGQVGTLLRSGLVPADLRSALYDALALLPGVRITEREATLDGRSGTAIGVRVGGYLDAVVIDPATGEYLGQRQTTLVRQGGVPAGTVADQTALRLSVVDAIPGGPAAGE